MGKKNLERKKVEKVRNKKEVLMIQPDIIPSIEGEF